MTDIQRNATEEEIVVSNLLAGSTAFPMSSYAGAMLYCPDGSSAGNLGFYIAPSKHGDFKPLHAHSAVGHVGIPVTPGIVKEFPPTLFSASWVKLVSDVIQPVRFILLTKS